MGRYTNGKRQKLYEIDKTTKNLQPLIAYEDAILDDLNLTGDLTVDGSLTVNSFIQNYDDIATTGQIFADQDITTITSVRAGDILEAGTRVYQNLNVASTSNTSGGFIGSSIGLANTTDATNATNGGCATLAGGLAVAKKIYGGTDLTLSGSSSNLALSGSSSKLTISGTESSISNSTGAIQCSGGARFGGSVRFENNVNCPSNSNFNMSGALSTFTHEGTTTSTSSTTGSVKFSGGLGISNTTDATSSTDGGTFTTAGGIAVAKKAYIGSNLNISNGTVGAPSLTFTSDTNTGLYSYAADQIGISVGGQLSCYFQRNLNGLPFVNAPVVSYNFDVSLTADQSGNSMTLTNNNSVTQSSVTGGSCLQSTTYNVANFSAASSQYLSRAISSSDTFDTLMAGSFFSVSLWVAPTLTAGEDIFVFANASSVKRYRMYFESGLLKVLADSGSNYMQLTTPIIPDKSSNYFWHIGFSHGSAGSLLTIDGELVTPTYTIGTASTAYVSLTGMNLFQIGAYTTPSNYFSGKIRNMIFWNTILNEAEFKAIYNYQKL